jgi:hypothetical protein
MMIDNEDVWSVGQSFNALAARAPTSFTKADAELMARHDQHRLLIINAMAEKKSCDEPS